jgi:hypothetical protein
MDAVSRSHDVNWSAMAHPLFEAEVTALERSRSDRTAAIKRLRASKAEAERQQLIQGRIDGREWVENRAEYEVLKRLKKNSGSYQSAWDRPWEQLRCAVDPLGQFTDNQVSAHFFGEGDDDHHPYYLSAFLAGALETWDEFKPEVESADEHARCPSKLNRGDAIAPIAVAKAPQPTSAHSAARIADAQRAIPLTNRLAAPSQRDAVTLALAAVTEAPPPENPPPRTRPVLKIVGDVIDAIVPTSMREWLFNEHPMDYQASKPS